MPSTLTATGIRERRGALLFVQRSRLLLTCLFCPFVTYLCRWRGRNPAAESKVMWRDVGSLMMEDFWCRGSSDRWWEMLEKERLISHDRAVRSGWNFDNKLISPCSSHLHGWIFHRTPKVPENQSHPSDWVEAVTPKSSPPPLWIFFVFWLSLDSSSPARKGEKLRPKLGIFECLSLFWRRRTRGDRHRSKSNTTRPRIGTKTGLVGRFWWGILLEDFPWIM